MSWLSVPACSLRSSALSAEGRMGLERCVRASCRTDDALSSARIELAQHDVVRATAQASTSWPTAGFTLEDLRIRQDLLSALALPLALRGGEVKRLHVGGDWTFSKGLRPRIEVSGVNVQLAFLPSPRILRQRALAAADAASRPLELAAAAESDVQASADQPAGSSAQTRSVAWVVQHLLQRVCIRCEDVSIVLVDSTAVTAPAAASTTGAEEAVQSHLRRCTSAGVRIQRITSEGPDQPVISKAAGSGAFARRIDIDVAGAFWAPEDVAREDIARERHAPPEVLLAPADTQQWLVLQPFQCQVWDRCIIRRLLYWHSYARS